MAAGYTELTERSVALHEALSRQTSAITQLDSIIDEIQAELNKHDDLITEIAVNLLNPSTTSTTSVEREDLTSARSRREQLRDELMELRSEREHLNKLRTGLQDEVFEVDRELAAFAPSDANLASQLGSTGLPQIRFEGQDPALTVDRADVGELAADLEPLMADATRLLDDDQLPIDIHDAVRARLTTLRAELQMYGDVSHDAVIITRSAAYLMAVVAGTVATDPADDNPLAPEVAAVATGAMDLGSDTTAEQGGRAIAAALDDLDALPEPEPGAADSTDSASAALTRGSRRWLEHDLWDTHVNRVVTGSITAAKRAGTAGLAGIAAMAESERISAVFRAGRALLKARYPGIFP